MAVVVRGLAMGEITSKDAFKLLKRESVVGITIEVTIYFSIATIFMKYLI
ncbi:hypothetical protein GOQ29_08580 [Clostridium sp. D2Q-14]|nr:hypothetical protein [Anaeromonas gelatinilytica]MBS4535672.1 hypothetical protein [Anaeromonas gelatinilytica]